MSTNIVPRICSLQVVKHTTFSRTVNARFRPLASSRPAVVSMKQPLMPNTNLEAVSTLENEHLEADHFEQFSLKEYFEQSRNMLSKSDGGPPRWFSPLECRSRSANSPLLLSLPGIDGTGLSLLLHHQRLGEIFDIWCLHIPITDRTPFTDLVKLVIRIVTSENYKFPNRPIYLVGESIGGCLALAVAAQVPHIDLVLLLANPATSFSKSLMQPLIPILKIIPHHIGPGIPCIISLITGMPSRMTMATAKKGLPSQQKIKDLSEAFTTFVSYLSVLSDVVTVEIVLWKLKMMESACEYSNSRLNSITSQTLILSSGNDQLFPSVKEGERLHQVLPKSQIRTFPHCSHALFIEEQFDLVTVIKGASFYRRAKHIDYTSDFLPPTPHEIKTFVDSTRSLDVATSPVMLSTLEDGKIVRSLFGIPSEGPVLFVGYHNMLALEVVPMLRRFLVEQKFKIRVVAHPMFFKKSKTGWKITDPATYDVFRVIAALPVSASNLYKLFSMKSHVILYPGGIREALHRKEEEYKLFWPEHSEFVRMAARFGATIIPFGAVGEDDYAQAHWVKKQPLIDNLDIHRLNLVLASTNRSIPIQLLFDYDDQMKIPFLKNYIKEITEDSVKLRSEMEGDIGNQDLHMPILLPKIPGRYYYLFGKPFKTKGRTQELLMDRAKTYKMYIEVKREVEKCLAYCQRKRENDPYRNVISRFMYHATHGLDSKVPTFDLD